MSLRKQIEQDIKKAMKAKDQSTLEALRFLLSQIKQKEIDSRPNELSEADQLKVIQKQVQKAKDSLDQFKSVKREDLVKKTEEELDVYRKYLPQPLEDEALERIVLQSIEELKADSMKHMGLVIKDVLSRIKGRADSRRVSQWVRKHLV